MVFVQPTVPAPVAKTVDAYATESYKLKYFEDIVYDKIATLQAKVRAIKGVDLYNPIRAAKICLIPNMVVSNVYVDS